MTIRRFGFTRFCLLFALLCACALSSRAQSSGVAPCCRSALEITANRNVQLLAVAPNGLKTGYDPFAIGSHVNQIPSSLYSLGFAEPGSAAGQQSSVERKIEIHTPAAGRYLVQAIGVSTGNFTIRFKATDEHGKATVRQFDGAAGPGTTLVYIVHYSPAPTAKRNVVPLLAFSAFSASLDVSRGSPPSFRITANVSLGSPSAHFDPVAQPVTLRLASYAVTIPPGSFVRSRQGSYTFDGTIEGVTLHSHIAPGGPGKFAFRMEVRGIDMSAAINPVRILLLLGPNAGSASVNAVVH